MTYLNNLASILLSLPELLVWLAGIVIAVVLWQRHPRLSLLVVIILAVLLVVEVLGAFASATLPLMMHSRFGMPIQRMANVMTVINLLNNLVHAGAWALILYAVFGWRNSVPTAPPPTESV